MSSASAILYLASNNSHKLEELKAIAAPRLGGLEVRLARDLDPKIDWDETGTTFAANARIKADVVLAAARAQGIRAAVLADDSGLEVEALGGAPGVYSARYAGKDGDDAANNAKLLKELAGVPAERRGAKFVCVLHYIDWEGKHATFRGECLGSILMAARGGHGFGYDPLFLVAGTDRALAELPAAEKNAVSHRRRALDEWLAGAERTF